jgi:hypothetical protein
MCDEPVGYLLEWVTPAGDSRRQWYQRVGNARNHAEKLGTRGEGVKVRLLRTTNLTDITSNLKDIYDSSAAEKRAAWATSAWRKSVLRHEPGVADWLRNHKRAEGAFDWAERRLTRAARPRLRSGGRAPTPAA